MTIESEVSSKTFEGNDSSTTFTIPFRVFEEGDIEVLLADNGSSSVVPENEYSVELLDPGAIITYPLVGDPLATGKSLVIRRDMDFTQNIDIQNNSDFLAELIEAGLDRLTVQNQQQKEEIARAVKVFPGSEQTADELIDLLVESAESASTDAGIASASAIAAAEAAEDAEGFKNDVETSSTDIAINSTYRKTHTNPVERQTVLTGKDDFFYAGNNAKDSTGYHNTTVLYAGDNLKQKILTGLDMGDGYDAEWSTVPATDNSDTGEEWDGGLSWGKQRNGEGSHLIVDSLRGSDKPIGTSSNQTQEYWYSPSFDNTFIDGYNELAFDGNSGTTLNNTGKTYALWNFRTTHRIKGLTSASKPYWTHYNPTTGFFITVYEGVSPSSQIVPLPSELTSDVAVDNYPKMVIIKSLEQTYNWYVFDDERGFNNSMYLNDASASIASSEIGSVTTSGVTVSGQAVNDGTRMFMMIGFCTGQGYFDVGSVQNTEASFELPDVGFNWLLMKEYDTTAYWTIQDAKRGFTTTSILFPNDTEGEASSVPSASGLTGTTVSLNSSGYDLIYLAAKMDFIQELTLKASSEEPLIATLASGYDSQGAIDSIVEMTGDSNVITDGVPVAGTIVPDATHYLYMDLDDADEDNPVVSFGVTLERPEVHEGNEDSWNIVQGHYEIDSLTSQGTYGIATAPDVYDGNYTVQKAFDGEKGSGVSYSYYHSATSGVLTDKWFNYEFINERVVDYFNYAITDSTDGAMTAFNVIGSIDGTFTDNGGSYYDVGSYSDINWIGGTTPEEKTFIPNGVDKDVPIKHFRIKPLNTIVGGAFFFIGELEIFTKNTNFNTKDYLMKSPAGTPIKRLYLGEFETDADGDIVKTLQYPFGTEWESEVYDINASTAYSFENPFKTSMICTDTLIRESEEYAWVLSSLMFNGIYFGIEQLNHNKDILGLYTHEYLSPVNGHSAEPKPFSNNDITSGQLKIKLRRDF